MSGPGCIWFTFAFLPPYTCTLLSEKLTYHRAPIPYLFPYSYSAFSLRPPPPPPLSPSLPPSLPPSLIPPFSSETSTGLNPRTHQTVIRVFWIHLQLDHWENEDGSEAGGLSPPPGLLASLHSANHHGGFKVHQARAGATLLLVWGLFQTLWPGCGGYGLVQTLISVLDCVLPCLFWRVYTSSTNRRPTALTCLTLHLLLYTGMGRTPFKIQSLFLRFCLSDLRKKPVKNTVCQCLHIIANTCIA